MIVDDNEAILEFMCDALEPNYHIFCAGNGLEALDLLQDKPIDLIISDVRMPKMDGFQLCQHIKSSAEFAPIPIILLTAMTALQAKINGLEYGADAYLEKPFSLKFLEVQISNLLRNRDALKTYFSNSPITIDQELYYTRSDDFFLEKLKNTINRNLNNSNLDVEHLAEEMNMSRPTLYRRIKSISQLTPNELINLTRLKKVAELLNEGILKIYEISELVGYSSHTHLGRNFLRHFGMSPTEYVNKLPLDKRREIESDLSEALRI